MTLSENGKKFIQNEEGLRLSAYLDSVKIPTIGWGNTYYLDGTKVKMGDKITHEQAVALFDKLIPTYAVPVNKLQNLTQNQYDALLSLTWNIGVGGFSKSTLFTKVQDNPNNIKLVRIADVTDNSLKSQLIKEKREYLNTIEYSFLVWNKAGSQFNIDLYHRRNREYKLYSTK